MAWLKVLGRRGRAKGVISGFEWMDGNDTDVKVPRIQFEVNGNKYSFLPSTYVRGDYDPRRIGTNVEVAYNPSNPGDADLASGARTYGPPIVLTASYLIVLWIAFFR
jgi:hypothetical protein